MDGLLAIVSALSKGAAMNAVVWVWRVRLVLLLESFGRRQTKDVGGGRVLLCEPGNIRLGFWKAGLVSDDRATAWMYGMPGWLVLPLEMML